MNAISIIVISLIALAFIAACVYSVRHKSISSCCGDCSKCKGCDKNKA